MQETIEQFLSCGEELPSPPAIAVRILEEIKKETCSLDGLAAIIETDPALVVKIVKAANSPYYGPVTKVDSLSRGLSILGLNAVKNIVLSFVLAENIGDGEAGVLDYNDFWRRSVTAAVSAELLCELIGVPPRELFITSLLQDIGLVFMSICSPDRYRQSMAEASRFPMRIADAETRIFGFTHQALGRFVLESWGFPENIYAPIGAHHAPAAADDDWQAETEILYLSGLLSMIYHGQDAVEAVQRVRQAFGERHDIDGDRVDALIDAVARRTIEMLSFFEIPAGEMKPYSQILQDANKELGKLNLTYEQLLLEYKNAKEEAENLAHALKAANRKLRRLASTDGLTGLYNHRTFQHLLEKRINEAKRHKRNLALILLDLDHFKCVNDSHGHMVGDAVLKSVSKRIGALLRLEDIFARYGGEEFAVILPETDIDGAVALAERIRQNIAGMCLTLDGITIRVTVSQGVAAFHPRMPAMTKSALVDMADTAMYAAKQGGRNAIRSAATDDLSIERIVSTRTAC